LLVNHPQEEKPCGSEALIVFPRQEPA
jgi:hypothetical protein